jgi:hypothetical protein
MDVPGIIIHIVMENKPEKILFEGEFDQGMLENTD